MKVISHLGFPGFSDMSSFLLGDILVFVVDFRVASYVGACGSDLAC